MPGADPPPAREQIHPALTRQLSAVRLWERVHPLPRAAAWTAIRGPQRGRGRVREPIHPADEALEAAWREAIHPVVRADPPPQEPAGGSSSTPSRPDRGRKPCCGSRSTPSPSGAKPGTRAPRAGAHRPGPRACGSRSTRPAAGARRPIWRGVGGDPPGQCPRPRRQRGGVGGSPPPSRPRGGRRSTGPWDRLHPLAGADPPGPAPPRSRRARGPGRPESVGAGAPPCGSARTPF